MKKTIKVEARTWSLLKQRKQRKPDGTFETFAEVIRRLIKEKLDNGGFGKWK